MKYGILLLASMLVSISAYACPDLSGTYDVTTIVSSDGSTQQLPAGQSSFIVAQKGCDEVDVAQTDTTTADTGTLQFVMDGKPHTFMSIVDAGVIIDIACRFQGNGVVGELSMGSQPGAPKAGTDTLNLDASGKIFTESLQTPSSSFTYTAVRR